MIGMNSLITPTPNPSYRTMAIDELDRPYSLHGTVRVRTVSTFHAAKCNRNGF